MDLMKIQKISRTCIMNGSDNILEPGSLQGLSATRHGASKRWRITGGWVNFKGVERWNALMWQRCASSCSFERVFCCDKRSARCEELPRRRAAFYVA